MLTAVTFCSPDQAGMLLTSSTVGRWSGSIDDIDAGKIRPDRRRGAQRQRLHVIVDGHRDRPAAALDVGDPVGGVAHASPR